MKIKYKNACSIRDAELNFEKGKIYLIRGHNNSGKSSLFYTMASALLNTKETKNYINNDALKENPDAAMEVTLEDDAGNSFIFKRTSGSSTYNINGKIHGKIRRDNVFSLIDGRIEGLLYDENDVRKIVNIQGEDNGLFPFDRSEGEQFKLFERIFNISSTIAVLRSMSLDEDDIKSKIIENSNTINDNNIKLESLTNVLQHINAEDIQKFKNELINIINIDNNIYNAIVTYDSLVTYINNVDSLKELDVIDDISHLQNLEKDYEECAKLDGNIWTINRLVEFDDKTDIQQLYKIINDINVYDTLAADCHQIELDIIDIEVQLNDIHDELSTIEICPVCHKPLGENDLCLQ